MKRLLLIFSFFAASCNSSSPDDDLGVLPTVKIETSNVADNKANITATLETGAFYGAKIVTGVRVSSLSVNYSREIPLIKYIEKDGRDIELPYTTELSNLIFEQEYFCAIIVYDKTGRASNSDYIIFTADGVPDGISNDNSAGDLEDNPQ